jgi:hypothetical protein
MLLNYVYTLLAAGATLSHAALLPREEKHICGNPKDTYLKFLSCCNKTPSYDNIWDCDIGRALSNRAFPNQSQD